MKEVDGLPTVFLKGYDLIMKRKEFYQIVQPLAEKLYRFAYNLIPDDLQAEQLVIDGLNAFLIKERKSILNRYVDLENKKELQVLRRIYFKGILRFVNEIGNRRSVQLGEGLRLNQPAEFKVFYSLESKVRAVMSLRFEAQFSVEEIEDIMQIPRYEVIEKIHNGRFLLLNHLNAGAVV